METFIMLCAESYYTNEITKREFAELIKMTLEWEFENGI